MPISALGAVVSPVTLDVCHVASSATSMTDRFSGKIGVAPVFDHPSAVAPVTVPVDPATWSLSILMSILHCPKSYDPLMVHVVGPSFL